MNTRSRGHALALSALLLGACADRQAPTELKTQEVEANSGPTATLAHSPAGDPTAIPIGDPTRIEFLGSATASNRSLTLPLGPAPVDPAAHLAQVRAWLANERAAHPGGRQEAWAQEALQSVERLFAVQTPEDLRRLLGPARANIKETRSVRPIGPGVAEHRATYGLHGQDLLRVLTRARPADADPSLDCSSDPIMIEDPSCGTSSYDPNFDPTPVLADLAAMQAQVDAVNAELAPFMYDAGPGECDAERAALASATIFLIWSMAETGVYAWRRDVLRTYTYLKISVGGLGAFIAAAYKLRDCLRGARQRYPV